MAHISSINEPNFQAACVACHNAIDDANWVLAQKEYAKAEAINAAFLVRVENDSARQERRSRMDGLRQAIEAALKLIGRLGDGRRMIRTKMDSRAGRGGWTSESR